jgi:hypothetical protein
LVALLLEHGAEVRQSADKKSYLVPTAQPYGRFIDEMMGIQRYPEIRPAPNSGILEPYDVAAWSLPLMMGVDAERVKIPAEEQRTASVIKNVSWPAGSLSNSSKYYSAPAGENSVAALINAMEKTGGQVLIARSDKAQPVAIFAAHPQLAANAEKFHVQLHGIPDLPVGAKPMKPVRIGLYKSFVPSMDEGWTRFVLEQYGFDVKNIENKAVKAGNLNAAFNVIILPDSSRDVIIDGRSRGEGYSEELPPDYTGGIGKEGVRALRDFVEKGGTLITLARASEVISGEDFGLPVRNALGGPSAEGRASTRTQDFNVPGSLLRVYLDTKHPVAYGMPSEVPVFVDAPLAFQTSVPSLDSERSVIAWYPDDAKDILISGYAHGAERLERKAAAVSFTKGKGKIVMFGFRVQHRAQTEGTFPLLFNAIYWSGM